MSARATFGEVCEAYKNAARSLESAKDAAEFRNLLCIALGNAYVHGIWQSGREPSGKKAPQVQVRDFAAACDNLIEAAEVALRTASCSELFGSYSTGFSWEALAPRAVAEARTLLKAAHEVGRVHGAFRAFGIPELPSATPAPTTSGAGFGAVLRQDCAQSKTQLPVIL